MAQTTLGEELRRGEMHLPCKLTEKEVLERYEELTKVTQKKGDLEVGLDHWKADKKEEQKELEGEIRSLKGRQSYLARTITEGEEDRKVEVAFYIKDSTVRAVRTDIYEIVSERPATPEELQRPLPDDHPDPDSENAGSR